MGGCDNTVWNRIRYNVFRWHWYVCFKHRGLGPANDPHDLLHSDCHGLDCVHCMEMWLRKHRMVRILFPLFWFGVPPAEE